MTALDLPLARPPTAGSPRDGRSPLDGAFGILFGPAGVEQVKLLTCLADDGSRLPCLSDMAEILFSNYPYTQVEIEEPPKPPPAGRDYRLQVSPHQGVFRIQAMVGSYETMEACREGSARLEELLAEKYGRCRAYLDDGSSHEVIGQCDSRQLPERRAWAACVGGVATGLFYELVSADERERMIKAWGKHRPISADDL